MAAKLVANSILFIFIIISGVWMAKTGKPYSPLAFNLHKCIALAFIIYNIILTKGLIKLIEESSVHWLILILAGFFVLLILVSGGIISIQKEIMKSIILLHKISSGLAFLSFIGWFYLCLTK